MVLKNFRKKIVTGIVAVACCALMLPASGWANDFSDYRAPTQSETEGSAYFDIVRVGGFTAGQSSYFTAVDFFPAATSSNLQIGSYYVRGKMICATGNKIYLQKDYGEADDDSTKWVVVAEFDQTNYNMDPSFIHVSPDGTKIAIGPGWQKPLYIVPVSTLSASNPPDLLTETNLTKFPAVNYYDGDWVDNRYLAIDQGDNLGGSKVISVDTQYAGNKTTYTGDDIVTNISGYSSGVRVIEYKDNNNVTKEALVAGIGYGTYTGKIKLWNCDSTWFNPNQTPTSVNYSTSGKLLAASILSATYLDRDHDENLTVGGGAWYCENPPNEEIAYAALINKTVIAAVANGNDDSNAVDESVSTEYREFSPDPCDNDSSTGIVVSDWAEVYAVLWNPDSMPTSDTWDQWNPDDEPSPRTGCYGDQFSGSEWWANGTTPRMYIYVHDSSTDSDEDGVFDIFDTDF